MARGQVTGVKYGKSNYPVYDGAELGFPNYWYPIMDASKLEPGKPQPLTLLGQNIVFFREGDEAYALEDRCPHRGIPLSAGRQEFPCTISCVYHGWTFDLKTGNLVAALTDGADSPIVGKVQVRSYPVELRLGFVWIWMGEDTPVPVEQDIPDEWFDPDTVIVSRVTERKGDWRHGVENGFDEGHAKYLHRTATFVKFRNLPAWTLCKVEPTPDGKWITRVLTEGGFETNYPGLGTWPKVHFWNRQKGSPDIALRLPGCLRVKYGGYTHYEWCVPTTPGQHRYLQFLVAWRQNSLSQMLFKMKYWTWIRWVFHVQFNNQDGWMVELMQTPPERLYRPDVSIVAWRKLCETMGNAQRGATPAESLATDESEVPDEVIMPGADGRQIRAAKSVSGRSR